MLEELRRALHHHVSNSSHRETKESAMDEIRMVLRLFSSVYQSDLAEFKCLLKAGVDPNSTDCEGNSLMHIVIENGLYDMAEVLISHGRALYYMPCYLEFAQTELTELQLKIKLECMYLSNAILVFR